jgi:hypothetical protein
MSKLKIKKKKNKTTGLDKKTILLFVGILVVMLVLINLA